MVKEEEACKTQDLLLHARQPERLKLHIRPTPSAKNTQDDDEECHSSADDVPHDQLHLFNNSCVHKNKPQTITMMKLRKRETFPRGVHAYLAFVLLLSFCITTCTAAGKVVYLRLKGVKQRYDAAVHETLGRTVVYTNEALLMIPPRNNVELCNTTTTTTSATEGYSSFNNLPVALLVESTPLCSTQEQAANALVLSESSPVRYVIFVSDNFLTPAVLPDPSVELDGLDVNHTIELSYLFVSLNSGRSIRGAIETVAGKFAASSKSPHLGEDDDWNFRISISPLPNPTAAGTARLYLIFLAMLSGVFVLGPCCLYFLRWWTWRQQRNGADTDGLNNDMILTAMGRRQGILLTRQQVYALPELVYHDKEGDEAQVNVDKNEDLKTTSTICSVCIQDFQEGERIRLLPLCAHAYHTQCILPWLTERVGTCPDCKTSVIKRDEAVDASHAEVPEQAVVTGLATNDNTTDDERRRGENDIHHADIDEDALEEDRREDDALPI